MAMNCSRCGKKRGFMDAIVSDLLVDSYTCSDCQYVLKCEKEERLAQLLAQLREMVTTAFELPGHSLVRSLGMVRGIVVRSRSVVGTTVAELQTLAGGDITLFTQLCEKTRNDAFEKMLQHAAELDANAVIGTRYDATEIMPGVTEVLAYGTAVVVKPNA